MKHFILFFCKKTTKNKRKILDIYLYCKIHFNVNFVHCISSKIAKIFRVLAHTKCIQKKNIANAWSRPLMKIKMRIIMSEKHFSLCYSPFSFSLVTQCSVHIWSVHCMITYFSLTSMKCTYGFPNPNSFFFIFLVSIQYSYGN